MSDSSDEFGCDDGGDMEMQLYSDVKSDHVDEVEAVETTTHASNRTAMDVNISHISEIKCHVCMFQTSIIGLFFCYMLASCLLEFYGKWNPVVRVNTNLDDVWLAPKSNVKLIKTPLVVPRTAHPTLNCDNFTAFEKAIFIVGHHKDMQCMAADGNPYEISLHKNSSIILRTDGVQCTVAGCSQRFVYDSKKNNDDVERKIITSPMMVARLWDDIKQTRGCGNRYHDTKMISFNTWVPVFFIFAWFCWSIGAAIGIIVVVIAVQAKIYDNTRARYFYLGNADVQGGLDAYNGRGTARLMIIGMAGLAFMIASQVTSMKHAKNVEF